MIKKINSPIALALLVLLVVTGCDKTKPYGTYISPAQMHFTSTNKYISYYVNDRVTDSFFVGVGSTDVQNADRTVNFTATSHTATAGTQYTILDPSGSTVTIPAGKATSQIKIHGVFAQFPGTHRDTVQFTLQKTNTDLAKFFDTVNVVMQRYCPVDAPSFVGAYNNSRDIDGGGTYGPYGSQVVSVTPLTATSASLVLANVSFEELSPYAINNLTVTIDWANPAAFTVTIPAQIVVSGNFSGYGPLTLTGLTGVQSSTFSSCDNTFTLNYKLTVSAGSFGNFTTVMAR